MSEHTRLHRSRRANRLLATLALGLAACSTVPTPLAKPTEQQNMAFPPPSVPALTPVAEEGRHDDVMAPARTDWTGAARLVIQWGGRRIQWLPSDLARVECTVRDGGTFVASGSAVVMSPGGGSSPGTYSITFSNLPLKELDFDVEAYSEGSLAGTVETSPSATGSSRVQMLPNVATALEILLETTSSPRITAVSPLFTFVGDRILIEGSNLVENRVTGQGTLVPREPYIVRIGDTILDSRNASSSFDVLNTGRLSVRIEPGCTGGPVQFSSRGKTVQSSGGNITVLKRLEIDSATLPPAYLVADSATTYQLGYRAIDLGDLPVSAGTIPDGTFTWGILQEIADATQSTGSISSADRIVNLTGPGVLRAGKKYGVAIYGLYSGGGGVLRATASIQVGP